MERFARSASEGLTVVGLGTRNSLDDARAFVRRHSMRATRMVWDADGRSWSAYEVTYQPVTIVIGADGRVLGRQAGSFDGRFVERTLRKER